MTIGRFQNTRFQVIFLQIESLDFNLQTFEKQLLIIDEVQLKPDLFRTLQALIERRKREKEIWAIEIKRTTAPKTGRDFIELSRTSSLRKKLGYTPAKIASRFYLYPKNMKRSRFASNPFWVLEWRGDSNSRPQVKYKRLAGSTRSIHRLRLKDTSLTQPAERFSLVCPLCSFRIKLGVRGGMWKTGLVGRIPPIWIRLVITIMLVSSVALSCKAK
jgi:hypothetical protein